MTDVEQKQVEELKKKLENKDIFETIDFLNSEDVSDYELSDEVFLNEIVHEKITGQLDEILKNPRMTQETYRDTILIFILNFPEGIITLLKEEYNFNEILTYANFDIDESYVDELSNEDRSILIDKVGTYLPENIQKKYMSYEDSKKSSEERNKNFFRLLDLGNTDGAILQVKNMGQEQIMEILTNSINGLPGHRYISLISELDEKNKLKVIENGTDKLDGYYIAEIAEGMSDENKLKVMEIGIDRLDKYNITKIAKGMSDENKLKVMEIGIDRLDKYSIAEIAEGMSDENKLKVMEIGIDKLDGRYIAEIAEGMSDENKLKVMEIGIDKLDEYNITNIAEGMSGENKLKVIEIGIDKLDGRYITNIAKEMSDENKLKLLETIEGLGENTISDIIISMTSDEKKVEAIDKHKLSEDQITKIIISMTSDEKKVEAIDKYKLSEDQITKIIIRLTSDEKKIGAIDKYQLNEDQITKIIISMTSDEKKIGAIDKYQLNEDQITKIIISMESDEKKIGAIDKYQLNADQIIDISESMSGKNILRIVVAREKYGLNDNKTSDCLSLINDPSIIEEYIDKREEYRIDDSILYKVIEKLADRNTSPESLIIVIREACKGADCDKICELLRVKDAEYIRPHIIKNIIVANMGNSSVDIDSVNKEIDKIYEILLTNDLPDNFKIFEFFRNHNNHESTNYVLYGNLDKESRDNIIAGDLFRIFLESDNRGMRFLLELLHSGNDILTRKENQETKKETNQAVLLQYRDILYSLLDVTEENSIKKSQDYMEDLDSMRKYLNIKEDEDIGEALLKKYLEKNGLEYHKEKGTLITTLLAFMDAKKRNASKNNLGEVRLEVGDLIKGTSFEYVASIIQGGIRAKEFFMVGNLSSDATPLDTDFSEIRQENLQNLYLKGVIESTYSGRGNYGSTYLVIKKINYDADKKEQNYGGNSGANSTRYFRTGIGSSNISAIITSEWDDEYKYILAQNGFYIPVVDKRTEKVLFTHEEYMAIRDQMRGLTHYGAEEFIVDETAQNKNVTDKAETLRKNAEGKTSTEEKRQKVVDLIQSGIGKRITTEMTGDISTRTVEFIDTGSTGRGTNIPGDGDFDFMMKCANLEEQRELIGKTKEELNKHGGHDKGGSSEYVIRYADVKIDDLDSPVEVDVTSEQKNLEVTYSSDMCVKERLDSIRRNYGEEQLRIVINNIICAKKVLKENGVYKKTASIGATENGGFGGIGVENWILQNGGSFVKAMETFLENAIDKEGNEVSFEEFKKKYPIYDFGQNHRSNTQKHDHYVEGLSAEGFIRLKDLFNEKLKEYGQQRQEIEKKERFFESITNNAKEAVGIRFTDMSRISTLIAKLRTHSLDMEERGAVVEHA